MNYPTGDNLRESEINRYYGDDTIYDYETRQNTARDRREDQKLRKATKGEK